MHQAQMMPVERHLATTRYNPSDPRAPGEQCGNDIDEHHSAIPIQAETILWHAAPIPRESTKVTPPLKAAGSYSKTNTLGLRF
jgi:hypothetical protein